MEGNGTQEPVIEYYGPPHKELWVETRWQCGDLDKRESSTKEKKGEDTTKRDVPVTDRDKNVVEKIFVSKFCT
ncbi:unnamed protein product [Nippostrongylus brasiliensis]|uniref:Uncharacterized protein n=1 Tax=Nippostrongylus brasiliensis TaxID=27835 RepID=A0A0N4XCX9_NIPBR|nr:unnamed protein product [Nippostrongylus brasiliensis]